MSADAAAQCERIARLLALCDASGDATLIEGMRQVAAQVAALRKLAWCCRVLARLRVDEPDPVLALVTVAALEAWLRAHGFVERFRGPCFAGYRRPDDPNASWAVQVPLLPELDDYGGCVRRAIETICARPDFAPALVLAELLPEHGPWDAAVPCG